MLLESCANIKHKQYDMSKCTIRKIVKEDKEKLSDFVMKNFVPNEALMTEHIDNDVTIFDQARAYLEDQFEVYKLFIFVALKKLLCFSLSLVL